MAHASEHAAVYLISLVATVSLVLTFLAYSAWRRTQNHKLLYVLAAFGLFAVKGAITAWALWVHEIRHENLELLGAGFDFAIVALLVAPFLLRA